MYKQFLLSATAVATLALAGCNDDPTGNAPCDTIRNDIQGTRGDTVVTASGLRYIETRVGTGGEVRSCRGVAVGYSGALTNGTRFDSGTFAFTPGSGQAIRGFELGVLGMRVGGQRRLIIPPDLGYGSQANGPIPANSTLIFDIEAIEVE